MPYPNLYQQRQSRAEHTSDVVLIHFKGKASVNKFIFKIMPSVR